MSKITKIILLLSLIIFLIIGAWYSGFKYRFAKNNIEISNETILQQVKNVVKLGTVEGYFSDIYSYKDYYGINISPFQKKALIRIKAKILAGFKLDSIDIYINDLSKTIKISNIPPPEILSIDYDLDYYDITQGTFNFFTNEDYNTMNSQSKLFIKNTAQKSDLLLKARTRLNQHFELLGALFGSYGWKLEIEYKEANALHKK